VPHPTALVPLGLILGPSRVCVRAREAPNICAGAGAHCRSLGYARDDKRGGRRFHVRLLTDAGQRQGGVLVSPYLAITLNGSVPAFVIPSVAEGSAVRPGSHTNVCGRQFSHRLPGLGSHQRTGAPFDLPLSFVCPLRGCQDGVGYGCRFAGGTHVVCS
jgi:hypothetical protein